MGLLDTMVLLIGWSVTYFCNCSRFNEEVVIKCFEFCGEESVIWFSTQQVTLVQLAELGGGQH